MDITKWCTDGGEMFYVVKERRKSNQIKLYK